jgi:hypothetical protein
MENPLYIPFVNFNIYNIDEPDEEQNIKNINLLIDYTKDPNNFDLFINLLRTYRFLNKDKTVINNIRHSLTGETCMVSASEADNYLMMIYLICNWNCTISTDKQFNQLLTIMSQKPTHQQPNFLITQGHSKLSTTFPPNYVQHDLEIYVRYYNDLRRDGFPLPLIPGEDLQRQCYFIWEKINAAIQAYQSTKPPGGGGGAPPGAAGFKKYLKYKAKYLQLKNQLN